MAPVLTPSIQVNDLLSFKQQQASVVQAWESVRQAEESVSQGRAVMMFTIVTIVFVCFPLPHANRMVFANTLLPQLPLSFISSIFGMNNKEFTDEGPMTLRYELKLMCTSFTFVPAAVLLPFSHFALLFCTRTKTQEYC